jgi:hypothetical protein
MLCVFATACPAADGAGSAAGDAAELLPEWQVEVSAFGYFIAGEDDYLQTTIAADRGRLHLEARYNY